ncbi:MAG: hypothetical protein ACOYEB_04325 [Enterococcus lemanii]|jgi:putative aldouronate transport system substrate-binding protein
MKSWKKTLGITGLAFALMTLGACSSGKKEAVNSDGTVELLMYQVGDKPENYDELMAVANEKIKEKIGAILNLQ